MHRISVSPSEKKICFEFISFERQRQIKAGEPGHTLYIADFDVRERTITNLKPIANEAGKPIWFAYARWIDGESAVVYHSAETGQGPTLRLPIGRRLDQARVNQPGRRLPLSARRSGAVLKMRGKCDQPTSLGPALNDPALASLEQNHEDVLNFRGSGLGDHPRSRERGEVAQRF